jgi:tetratricopeptide (TPR) repeat protein
VNYSFREKTSFDVKSKAEQQPFESPAFLGFFKKWCEINDSIETKTVSRQEWEDILAQKGLDGILTKEKNADGKRTLFVPSDLKLWEMVGIIEAVDKDTFEENPQKQKEAKEKLTNFGKILQNAAVYIAKRLSSIKEGQEIAKALAEEFFEYGQSLIKGEKGEEFFSIDDIAQQDIGPQEEEIIDRFLAGESLYQSRIERFLKESSKLENEQQKKELLEKQRQKTLSQFFKSAWKAFELQERSSKGELKESSLSLKPWQSKAPIHTAFLQKVQQAIERQVESPKHELISSIFRRGMELLRKNMPSAKKAFFHWKKGERILRDELKIEKLKEELSKLRAIGTPEQVSKKEREIAYKIQSAVSRFRYEENTNNPSEIIANKHINCVGASLLGGVLLGEVGLNYLVASIPEHSILLLVTSDGSVVWLDMLHPFNNEDLKDEMIRGQKKDGQPLRVADIVAFSKDPKPEGMVVDIEGDSYTKKVPWLKPGERQYLAIFGPEYGQKLQILYNKGAFFRNVGIKEKDKQKQKEFFEKSVEFYKQAIALGPKISGLYNVLGRVLVGLKNYEEAIKYLRESIKIDPNNYIAYSDLGDLFLELSDYQKAIECCYQAIKINPEYPHTYICLGFAHAYSGNYDKAIEAFENFIKKADKNDDENNIKIAQDVIKRLKELLESSKEKLR